MKRQSAFALIALSGTMLLSGCYIAAHHPPPPPGEYDTAPPEYVSPVINYSEPVYLPPPVVVNYRYDYYVYENRGGYVDVVFYKNGRRIRSENWYSNGRRMTPLQMESWRRTHKVERTKIEHHRRMLEQQHRIKRSDAYYGLKPVQPRTAAPKSPQYRDVKPYKQPEQYRGVKPEAKQPEYRYTKPYRQPDAGSRQPDKYQYRDAKPYKKPDQYRGGQPYRDIKPEAKQPEQRKDQYPGRQPSPAARQPEQHKDIRPYRPEAAGSGQPATYRGSQPQRPAAPESRQKPDQQGRKDQDHKGPYKTRTDRDKDKDHPAEHR